jgi:signal transduction histidine kinase
MRAKQSSTASGIFSCSGTLTAPPIPIHVAAVVRPRVVAIRSTVPTRSNSAFSDPEPVSIGVAQGEGLLHDARNLMGALGLYCDLLSLPGVLKPEHSHYVDELRLLGARSGTLMERLVLSLPASEGKAKTAGARTVDPPMSLREIVERCSGLLSQVAGGRTIELSYGPAASTLVSARQEDVERILVNLVRNAAAALDVRGRIKPKAAMGRVKEILPDRTADAAPEAIRIGIGLLHNRVGDLKSWPFRRVRLTVEDSGCGMRPEQLERLLRSGRAPSRGGRGIGFCVVRELVAAGDGDLRVMSSPGLGTRVQIEWPVAVLGGKTTTAREGRWPIC